MRDARDESVDREFGLQSGGLILTEIGAITRFILSLRPQDDPYASQGCRPR
jgi:hypothetical protein